MIKLVSIAMATRNSSRFVAEALRSVAPAIGKGAEFEILISDGASDDDTVSIAARNERVRIVSRQDNGLYDGMNRAIAAARGEAIFILNSDDRAMPEVLGQAVTMMQKDAQLGMVSGNALFGATPDSALERRQECNLTQAGVMFGIPVINARLYRASLLKRCGPLLTNAGLGSDREFMSRITSTCQGSACVDQPIYFYRSHEGSKTGSNDQEGRLRVYGAEARIAAHLLKADTTSEELRKLARGAYALADFKLRVSGAGAAASIAPLQLGRPRPGLMDLVHGMRQNLRWRGKLSGG